MLDADKEEFLRQKKHQLIEKVKPTAGFWASLVKHGAISEVTKDNIKVRISLFEVRHTSSL